MDSSDVARQFARLVWLLVHDGSNVDEQKRALRGVLTAGRKHSVALTLAEWRVLADGSALPEDDSEVQTLAAQMIGHAVKELRVSQAAVAAHLLAVARALAKEPQPGGGGRGIRESLRTLKSPTIAAVMETVEPDTVLEAAPKAPRPPPRASGSYLAFAANPAPKSSIWELLVKLPEIGSAEEATMVLEGIVMLVNQALDEGKDSLVADTLCALLSGENARTDKRMKRAYTIALRQLRKPRMAKAVAKRVAMRPENLDDLIAVLGRWGQDGTEALIEELKVAETLPERRTLFDALVTVKAATPSLLRMLEDNRWFVLRNAAELLGELPSPDAEAPLAKLLSHDDERVRRAAAQSLGKIATGNAFAALRAALRDESAEVRLVAATALGSWKRATSSHSLVVALEGEEDGNVQLQIIATLGRVATPDAVQRLIELTEPGGTVFKRKTAAMRLAAVQALGEAATPAAVDALKALREDKDSAVREASYRLVRAMRAPNLTAPD